MTHLPPDPFQATAHVAFDLIHTRQTILPKRLLAPGPNADELKTILGAAAAAPDHGQLLPWRFVLVPDSQRPLLATAFERALQERDSAATEEQRAQAREKAFRAPVLLLLVVDAQSGDADIDLHERLISAGCAVQNVLLMATALGFGSALTSGKALKSQALRQLFELQPHEHSPCFISVGTALTRKPTRIRPTVPDYLHTLGHPRSPSPHSHEHHQL
jgi:nitroreductase